MKIRKYLRLSKNSRMLSPERSESMFISTNISAVTAAGASVVSAHPYLLPPHSSGSAAVPLGLLCFPTLSSQTWLLLTSLGKAPISQPLIGSERGTWPKFAQWESALGLLFQLPFSARLAGLDKCKPSPLGQGLVNYGLAAKNGPYHLFLYGRELRMFFIFLNG